MKRKAESAEVEDRTSTRSVKLPKRVKHRDEDSHSKVSTKAIAVDDEDSAEQKRSAQKTNTQAKAKTIKVEPIADAEDSDDNDNDNESNGDSENDDDDETSANSSKMKSKSKSKSSLKKLRKPNASVYGSKKTNTYSLSKSSLKTQIRNVKRLLAKVNEKIKSKEAGNGKEESVNLNDSVNLRKQKESELKILEYQLAQAMQTAKKHKIDKKYREIKFVETKKVTRKLKQYQKRLAKMADPSEEAHIRATIKDYEEKLHYIENYPSGKKYVALFPTNVMFEEKAKPADKND